MAAPEVPYVNPAKNGNACIAVKRALSRAGYMQWGEFTKKWGRFANRSCRNFQAENNLHVDGIYGEKTHNALEKTHKLRSTEWAFDAYSIAIMKEEQVSPEQQRMFKILDGAAWSIAANGRISYLMARPVYYYNTFPVTHNFWNDCSGMFAQWYKWGGAPDPHKNDYNGYGNTGTLWIHGATVNGLSAARPCDAVLYGQPWAAGAAAHVVMLTEKRDGIWYAASHGQEAGPVEVRADYRPIVGIKRFALL